MSDTPESRTVYPIRLEGVKIAAEQQACIDKEIARRGEGLSATKRRRLRNGIVRDVIDFTCEHYDLFLAWIAARGNSA